MNYDIEDQSDGVLKYVETLSDGSLLVYNTKHNKELVVRLGNELPEITDYIQRGWALHPGKDAYILRAPEFPLLDLSEPFHNPMDSLPEMLSYYKILKMMDNKELKSYVHEIGKSINKHECAQHIIGDSMEAEFRITCSSPDLFKELQAKTYEKIVDVYKEDWEREFKECCHELVPRKLNVHIDKFSDPKVLDAYSQWKRNYGKLGFSSFPKPEAITGVWKQLIDKNFDSHVFILGHGMKYALGYLLDGGERERIFLTETHLGMDFRKLLFFKNPEDLDGKNVALIDKFYSGSTLRSMSENLKTKNSHIVGMFPKCKEFLTKTDYIVFLDKFIESRKIKFDRKWCETLFIDVVNGEI